MIDPSEFRRVMGHLPTGVTVITATRPNGEPSGMTASAVCSLSLEPTLLLVCIDREAESYDVLTQAEGFAVNVLGEGEGERLARQFAEPARSDRFRGVAYEPGHTGAPILAQAAAWLECERREVLPGGDHGIFVGEVVGGDASDRPPLIYYRGGYAGLRR